MRRVEIQLQEEGSSYVMTFAPAYFHTHDHARPGLSRSDCGHLPALT